MERSQNRFIERLLFLRGHTMSVSGIKKQARLALKGNWGLGVGLYLLVFAISFLPTFLEITVSGGFGNWINDDVPAYASIGSFILSFLFIPISISVYWFYLTLVRNENPQISQVFSVYKDGKTVLKLIGTSLLLGIYFLLWTLLFIIPGIIKSLSYSQTYYLLKDHPGYSINEAITESRKRMKGLKGKYFLLNLSFIGWGILCLFTLGIGFLWLVPYITSSLATFYNELIATQDKSLIEE
jgi:uncharacterized membrane protein